MTTGQRNIDTLLIALVALLQSWTFGSGKTVVQHQLAKWADADIMSILMWERGNEMTDVLWNFELKTKNWCIFDAEPFLLQTHQTCQCSSEATSTLVLPFEYYVIWL